MSSSETKHLQRLGQQWTETDYSLLSYPPGNTKREDETLRSKSPLKNFDSRLSGSSDHRRSKSRPRRLNPRNKTRQTPLEVGCLHDETTRGLSQPVPYPTPNRLRLSGGWDRNLRSVSVRCSETDPLGTDPSTPNCRERPDLSFDENWYSRRDVFPGPLPVLPGRETWSSPTPDYWSEHRLYCDLVPDQNRQWHH